MKEGFLLSIRYSLLARSVLALQVGGGLDATLPGTLLLYVVFLAVLCIVPNRLLRFSDVGA